MIVLYILIAVFMQVLYTNVAVKTYEFWTNYFILKRGGIPVPVKPLVWYLTIALFLFTMFHILVITFTFVILE